MFHEGALPRIKGVGGVDIGFQTMRAEHRLGISLQYKNGFFFSCLWFLFTFPTYQIRDYVTVLG